jgi:uncharacterized protein (TIGR02453 family)
MTHPVIPKSAFAFLKTLKDNNDRSWFEANKDLYLENLPALETFADGLLAALNKHDLIETPSGKKSLWRIYRDVRFSKDKSPYKTHWGGHFTRAGRTRRGGYYYHLEPGNSRITGAFWSPSAPDLKLIRDDIAFDDKPLKKILNSKKFKATFGELKGEQLKRVPNGYDPNHPAADLLRHKQFLLVKTFTDKEVLSPSFLKQAADAFHQMRPFLDHMSEILSSNANGE